MSEMYSRIILSKGSSIESTSNSRQKGAGDIKERDRKLSGYQRQGEKR